MECADDARVIAGPPGGRRPMKARGEPEVEKLDPQRDHEAVVRVAPEVADAQESRGYYHAHDPQWEAEDCAQDGPEGAAHGLLLDGCGCQPRRPLAWGHGV